MLVPLNNTLTKGIGSPELASVTLPLIIVSCAKVVDATMKKRNMKMGRVSVFTTVKLLKSIKFTLAYLRVRVDLVLPFRLKSVVLC
jgi:hypothetical protein